MARVLLLSIAVVGCSAGTHVDRPACVEPHAPPSIAKGERRPANSSELRRIDVDIDGNGVTDRLVARSDSCDRADNCHYGVFLMDGACGRSVGAIWAHSVRRASRDKTRSEIIAATRDSDAEYEEWYRVEAGWQLVCLAWRERQLRAGAALDPLAVWQPWRGCPAQ